MILPHNDRVSHFSRTDENIRPGQVGNVSPRAALVVSAALLAPVLLLYRLAIRREEQDP